MRRFIVAVLGVAALAGCGATAGSQAATTTTTPDVAAIWREVVQCLRDNAMPNLPDPQIDADGQPHFPGGGAALAGRGPRAAAGAAQRRDPAGRGGVPARPGPRRRGGGDRRDGRPAGHADPDRDLDPAGGERLAAAVVPAARPARRPGAGDPARRRGHAVEVVEGGARRRVPVTTDLFDESSGVVEVDGPGLAEGTTVVVPAP